MEKTAIKPLKRMMETSNGSINSIVELLTMMGDEAIKRMERKLKLKIEEIDNSANFITDEERDLLIELYNILSKLEEKVFKMIFFNKLL